MSEYPRRMVTPLQTVYVGHVIRKPGVAFMYGGPPNPKLFEEPPEPPAPVEQPDKASAKRGRPRKNPIDDVL